MRSIVICSALLVSAGLLTTGLAAETPASKTHTVAAGPFRVETTVEGVFEPLDAKEIALDPEEWATLIVEKALPAGTTVEEGQEILWLRTREIDRAIRDLELQRALGRLGIEIGRVELAVLERTVSLDMEDAERSKAESDEDWAFFNQVGEKLERKLADLSLQSSKESMEGAQEELNQLEKMYKADDLTEETEEIILKRARSEAERAKAFFEQATVNHDRKVDVQMPRTRRTREAAVTRTSATFEKQRIAIPAGLQQKKLELEKLRHTQESLEEKLGKLTHDRELLTVKAPAGGTLYYGENDRGKWVTSEAVTKLLRKGSTVTPRQVLMTIVSGPRLRIVAEVPEKDLRWFPTGAVASARPTLAPTRRIPARVVRVNLAPIREGIYSVELELDRPDGGGAEAAKADETLRGGMTCKLTVAAVDRKDAIAVPSGALFSDDDSPDRKWVAVPAGEGKKPERRDVETGPASNSRTLIESGLKAGETILLTKPE